MAGTISDTAIYPLITVLAATDRLFIIQDQGGGVFAEKQLAWSDVLSVVDSRISTHNSVTTGVHGITDTAVLVTLAGTQTLTAKTLTNATLNGTTGTIVGSSATDKVSLFGVAAVVQPSGAAQAAAASQTQATLTDSTAGTAGTTLAALGGSVYNLDAPTLRDWTASLAARLAEVKADVAAIKTLQNAQRTAEVALGAMKGSA